MNEHRSRLSSILPECSSVIIWKRQENNLWPLWYVNFKTFAWGRVDSKNHLVLTQLIGWTFGCQGLNLTRVLPSQCENLTFSVPLLAIQYLIQAFLVFVSKTVSRQIVCGLSLGLRDNRLKGISKTRWADPGPLYQGSFVCSFCKCRQCNHSFYNI